MYFVVGNFEGERCRFKVTSVCGHVMALDFEGQFNNWEKVDPAELFSAPTLKKESNPKLNIVKYVLQPFLRLCIFYRALLDRFLEKEARGVDCVVLWLDCDKEGENICYEVLDIVTPVMNKNVRNFTCCIF